MPSTEALNVIRSWIAVAQSATPVLADDVAASVPDDFVKQRQADVKVSARRVLAQRLMRRNSVF